MITPHIVQVNAFVLDKWWSVLEPALENMPHVFNTSPEGRPVLEIQEKIAAGLMNAWVGLEEHEGEEHPRLVAGMLTVVNRDPVTEGKHLLIYALWSYQPISQEMMEYGRMAMIQHAQEQNCPQILTRTTDERMKRWVEKMGFFDGAETFFIADVEGLPWVEEAVDLARSIGQVT